MNILILVSSLEIGGAQKQAVLDANMLSHSNEIFLGMFSTGALEEQLNEKVKKVVFEKQNYWSTATRLARFVKEHRIQVVHNHLYAPMLIAALASLQVNVPVLWHFHGHHFEVRRLPLNVLSMLPTVKRLIFVCSALARYFENNYMFPKSKIDVVYNSSQCKRLPAAQPKDEVLRIGYIGRVVKLKRIQYLVHLAAFFKAQQFEQYEIWVIGDGPERASLELLAQDQSVSDKVKFLGFRTDMEHLYNQLDFFVLPSEEEALSLALIDASNCALPCIAFDVGGNQEIVLDGKTGYIVRSEEELQQRAYELCQDAELRRTLGAQAERHAQIFSEKNHLKKLMDIYAEFA